MFSLDLPLETIGTMQNLARDASISAARTFGFGGSNWSVQRPSGVGLGARTLVTVADIHGLAYLQRPSPLARLETTETLDDDWKLILFDGTLKAQDVITSASDSTYTFTVISVEPWYDYDRATLTRR